MGHAQGHAQRGLPIALQLVAAKIEVPAGYAVQLAEHGLAPILAHRALALFGGGILALVAQHIDARDAEGTVRTHGLAQRAGLAQQRRLLHHVACERQVVFVAPGAAGVRERGSKPFGYVVVIVVADFGNLAAGQFPDQLGQVRY